MKTPRTLVSLETIEVDRIGIRLTWYGTGGATPSLARALTTMTQSYYSGQRLEASIDHVACFKLAYVIVSAKELGE